MKRDSLKRELYAEFLGTLVLIAFGAGVVAQVVLSNKQNGEYLSINLAWGFGVTMGIYVAGGVSGAHLNPAVTAGLMFTGYSRTSWLGIPLPLNMAPIGMPGCSLLTSGQIILVLNVSAGVGSLALPLPADAALLVAPFYQQALIVDLPANPAGLILSNGAAGRFGQR